MGFLQSALFVLESIAFLLEESRGSRKARQDPFFAENFKHLVKAGTDRFTARGNARWMDEVSDFDAKGDRCFLQLCLYVGVGPFEESAESLAKSVKALNGTRLS